MLGLFGTINLAAESLQVQRQGIEVAGHNLANVNNSAYARQRVNIETAVTLPSPIGPQGTGAQVVRIQQLRSAILDGQIQSEAGVRGFLEAEQAALQLGEAILGQTLDRKSTGAGASSAAQGAGGQHGIAGDLSDLFNAFQSLSTDPTSLTERQSVLLKAQSLASQFNQIDAQLADLQGSLNDSLKTDAATANDLLASIAQDNKQIAALEGGGAGAANDLRDLRQQHLEQLSKLVNIQTVGQPNGTVDVSISGTTVVSGVQVVDQLETYDTGGGQFLVRTQTTQTPLTLTGGTLGGTIEARDGALQTLRNDTNQLAGLLITEVNSLHRPGYSLNGETGKDFFTGSGAADIQVNSALLDDPAALQASGESGAAGDNQVALALAQLADQPLASLNQNTFSENFSRMVGALGHSISVVNGKLDDQSVVEQLLLRQRDAVSGVSLDEEMTDLMKFQKAFQASARLITTVDEMLQTVLNMIR